LTETTTTPTATDEPETPECRQHGPMVLRTNIQAPATATWYCPDEVCTNTVLHPAKDTPRKGEIAIVHTRADGTLLEGSRKGDGVWEIVREHGFRSSRNIGLYIQQSRDKAAKRWYIDRAAEALRAAGWTVVIDIDEDTRRSFAEAEADRVERAGNRADRFDGYADNAASRSDAAYAGVKRIADGIPMGQPILVGHHSEAGARRDVARMDAGMRRSIDEGDKAAHWASRAKAAGSYEEFRKAPGRTLRRIAKLEADLRRVEKWLRGESAGGFTRDLTPATVAELNRRKEELEEEIGFWRHVIAKAEEGGFKVWGKADFKRGDFVLYGGTWYEVLRVNAKSVSIPHIHNGTGRRVVRKGDGHVADWTWLAPYDDVRGRRTAEEQAAVESPAEPVAEAAVEDERPARFAVAIETDEREWMRFHERDRAVACAAGYGLGEEYVKDTHEPAAEAAEGAEKPAAAVPVMHEDRFLPLDR
jgi:hypothetical protein